MKQASRVYISRIREDQLRHFYDFHGVAQVAWRSAIDRMLIIRSSPFATSRTAASIRAERYSNDYSTVTLLVRLRGGSTSVPLATNV